MKKIVTDHHYMNVELVKGLLFGLGFRLGLLYFFSGHRIRSFRLCFVHRVFRFCYLSFIRKYRSDQEHITDHKKQREQCKKAAYKKYPFAALLLKIFFHPVRCHFFLHKQVPS